MTRSLSDHQFGRMPTLGNLRTGSQSERVHGLAAGAGVKRGFTFGATDEFGYQAVENLVDVRLSRDNPPFVGLDHERLRFNTMALRWLTDVHGKVIRRYWPKTAVGRYA
jgi:hypothetical protein